MYYNRHYLIVSLLVPIMISIWWYRFLS